jgi:hypothetical protein
MKNLIYYKGLGTLAMGLIIARPMTPLLASETNSPMPAASVTAGATVAQPAPVDVNAGVHLPYGAAEVVKLSQAQISDDIIINYIQNSGTIYNLGPNEMVALKNQGVSDRVINAMISQRNIVAAQPAPQPAPQPAAPAPEQAPAVAPTDVAPAPAPTYTQAPNSSLYVIQSPAVSSAYYGYYAPYSYYYPPYYSYGPAVSFGFGFGGYYGGYHGGYYHGHGGWGHGGWGHGGYHH